MAVQVIGQIQPRSINKAAQPIWTQYLGCPQI